MGVVHSQQAEHFVAVVQLTHVNAEVYPGRDDVRRDMKGASITVRSGTLEKLKEKVAAHLALVDQEDFGNERHGAIQRDGTRGS